MEIDRIHNLMKKYNLTPSKSKGQNFLIDENIVTQIIKIANIETNTNVLEIGPGFGVLTSQLVQKSGKLLVVELDKNAIEYLKEEFKDLQIIEDDILNIPVCEIAGKLDGVYKVVANIPYNITSRIIRNFTQSQCSPVELILMVQKEVGQRVVAKAGKMSKLSVSVQFYADASYELDVPRDKFIPIPAVDSGVIKIAKNDKYQKLLKVSERDFFRVVTFGFAAKRKKLSNNLSAGLVIPQSKAVELMEKVGLESGVRAQNLTVQNWIDLANLIYG